MWGFGSSHQNKNFVKLCELYKNNANTVVARAQPFTPSIMEEFKVAENHINSSRADPKCFLRNGERSNNFVFSTAERFIADFSSFALSSSSADTREF